MKIKIDIMVKRNTKSICSSNRQILYFMAGDFPGIAYREEIMYTGFQHDKLLRKMYDEYRT